MQFSQQLPREAQPPAAAPQALELNTKQDQSTEWQLHDGRTNELPQKGCTAWDKHHSHTKLTRKGSSASKGGSKGFQAAAGKQAACTPAYPSSQSIHLLLSSNSDSRGNFESLCYSCTDAVRGSARAVGVHLLKNPLSRAAGSCVPIRELSRQFIVLNK